MHKREVVRSSGRKDSICFALLMFRRSVSPFKFRVFGWVWLRGGVFSLFVCEGPGIR